MARQPGPCAAEDEVVRRPDGGSYSGGVRFEVLGRLRVIDGRERGGDEGAEVRLGGARQQLVLAMLLADRIRRPDRCPGRRAVG